MKIVPTEARQFATQSSPAPFAIAQLVIAGLIGGLCLVLAGSPSGRSVVATSLVALAVLVAIVWQQSRRNAQRRFLAVLDAYADREINELQLAHSHDASR